MVRFRWPNDVLNRSLLTPSRSCIHQRQQCVEAPRLYILVQPDCSGYAQRCELGLLHADKHGGRQLPICGICMACPGNATSTIRQPSVVQLYDGITGLRG